MPTPDEHNRQAVSVMGASWKPSSAVNKTGSTYRIFAGGVMPECPHCTNRGTRHTRDLTEEQWKILDPIIPKPMKREDGRGPLGKTANPF
jgi:pyruvate-formate lyase-activating enzyme